MLRESGQSPERFGEGSRESRRERIEQRDRSGDRIPTVDRSRIVADTTASDTTAADTLAINEARAIAIERAREDKGATEQNRAQGVLDRMWERTPRPVKVVAKVGVGSIKVAVGASAVFAFLGLKTTRPIARGILIGIDWLGHKMNSWADKLIDKNLPVLSWFINPLVSLLDKSAKSLGIDKTLAEHLKNNAEDRKKLTKKMFMDYIKEQESAEKKMDAEAKKRFRQQRLKEVLGEDVAAVLEEELKDLEKVEATKTEPVPVATPAETAKAT